MGKHKRSRNRRGRKKEQKSRNESSSSLSGPPLLSRIRHADPQTRLAALTALAQHRRRGPFNSALWQAVCEQVVTNRGANVTQLSIATIAATIMAEWTSSNDETTETQNSLTAGWPLVLQGQMQMCLNAWKNKGDAREHQLWGRYAWQCLYAWSSLVESNPVVMDRFQQQPSLRNDALTILKDWLLITTIDRSTVVSDPNDRDTLMLSDNIAETTARALHSLLQDNPAIIEPWWDEMETTATWLTTQIPFILENNIGPVVSRLHLSGVWMTCRSVLSDILALQSTSVLQSVARTLQECLVLPIVEGKLEMWQNLYQMATNQTQDDELERQVVRKQTEKNESARQIARRLAHEKGGGMQLEDETEENAMEEEEMDKPGRLPNERPDHVQNWEDILQGWEISLRPLELSLEIIAHLTAVAPEDSVMMDDDDANLAMQSAVWDPLFKQHFQDLPKTLFLCFQDLYQCESSSLPTPMAWYWSELQSKASVGLGHCLTQLSRQSQMDTIMGMTKSQIWQHLWSALRRTLETSSGRQTLLGLIVVALQNYPAIRKEVTPSDLDFLISLVQSRKESTEVRREAVVILGILCSQEIHSEVVNRNVCGALTGLLDNMDEPLSTRAEVLNVLIDIYGNDEHPNVFNDLNVLNHFVKSLPILKRQLSELNRDAVDGNDIAYWREVALNSERFIEYKYQQ
jgi:hypothetical protein